MSAIHAALTLGLSHLSVTGGISIISEMYRSVRESVFSLE